MCTVYIYYVYKYILGDAQTNRLVDFNALPWCFKLDFHPQFQSKGVCMQSILAEIVAHFVLTSHDSFHKNQSLFYKLQFFIWKSVSKHCS